VKVAFVKTGARRYAVEVHRDRYPDLRCGSIGGDEYLPHDILHFVAEAELGLDGGVFGDLACGGNARIFIPVDPTLVAKMWRKQRIRKTRLPDGRRSEELAAALARAWRTRRSDDPRVERLIPRLDELAERWHALAVGGSLTLEWPRAERGRLAARRASAAAPARRRARS
jgi:hypothetical protein